jgi:protein-tyrosine-phosphatase
MKSFRLLFVCTGNTCRSPMAELLARRHARNRGLSGISATSAGTAAGEGAPASAPARAVALAHGGSLESHRSRGLTAERIEEADLIVVMTDRHARFVSQLDPRAVVILATSVLPDGHPARGTDVPDPFNAGLAEYERTWDSISVCVEALLDRIARQRGD